jgi:hypothetical protein
MVLENAQLEADALADDCQITEPVAPPHRRQLSGLLNPTKGNPRMKHALLALALIAATPVLAVDVRIADTAVVPDMWGCPSKNDHHYCDTSQPNVVRMQCPYGCSYADINGESFETAADGYIYVPRELMAQAKGLQEY